MTSITEKACKSPEECLPNATCEKEPTGSICVCKSEYVGYDCQFENPCNANPCGNDGTCVPIEEDGSFYCDCPVAHIHPRCEHQNPCELGGNEACLNGSTCTRFGDNEFICRCRLPYVGEFCESFNLCDVDQEECIEDISFGDDGNLVCSPCVYGANCTQLSSLEYLCSCDARMKHTNCIAASYAKSGSVNTPLMPRKGPPEKDIVNLTSWNPIIPSIGLTCCLLYFFILFILFLCYRKRSQSRPKLLVCCDIQEFDFLAYYLISVETERAWGGGTDCNVYCYLCGENGNAGPFPLSDSNLRGVNVLRPGQEDNYLVAHTEDLGQINKLLICYHDVHSSKSDWSCERVTVRNIKSKENWFFFISNSIRAKSNMNTYEFFPASKKKVAELNSVRVDCKHFVYQMAKHHVYISPLANVTSTRIMLAFTEFMTYMLFLFLWWEIRLPINYEFHSNFLRRLIIVENGSIGAAVCFMAGLFYALPLQLARVKQIPTLLVHKEFANSAKRSPLPDSPAPQSKPQKDKPIKKSPEKKKFADTAVNTDPIPQPRPNVPQRKRVKKLKQVQVPVARSSELHGYPFRIPSTNIPRLEEWIYENAAGTLGPEDLEEDSLVHDSTTLTDKISSSYSNIDITNAQNFETYQTVNVEVSEEEDVNDLYENEINDTLQNPPEANNISTATDNDNSAYEPKREQHDFAAGDSVLIIKDKPKKNKNNGNKSKIPILPPPRPYCELVEMHYRQCKLCCSTNFLNMIGWTVPLGLIIASTVICYKYGALFSPQKTYDWLFALLVCWLQNFFLYQFLKVLVLTMAVTLLVNSKKLSSYEADRIKHRFQLYYHDGRAQPFTTYKLKYITYLPKYWKPIPTPNKI